MRLFEFRSGDTPLVVSLPHAGTWVPDSLYEEMTVEGRKLKDTDWYLPRLYAVQELDRASVLSANVSRYVVDLNRSRQDDSLYPGQYTTGLCPQMTFAGEPIYKSGPLNARQIEERIRSFWEPYHQQLNNELESKIQTFGYCLLLDGHSIASVVPRLFSGTLPDFNFGTHRGRSCGPTLQTEIEKFAEQARSYSSVINERFIGGYITRSYGSREAVHAVQLELSQKTYMNEKTLDWDDAKANQVQRVIRDFLGVLIRWMESQ